MRRGSAGSSSPPGERSRRTRRMQRAACGGRGSRATSKRKSGSRQACRFAIDPYDRSSMPTTSYPSRRSRSQRCEPINPAAPVTPTFFTMCSLSPFSRSRHAAATRCSTRMRARMPGTTRSATPVTLTAHHLGVDAEPSKRAQAPVPGHVGHVARAAEEMHRLGDPCPLDPRGENHLVVQCGKIVRACRKVVAATSASGRSCAGCAGSTYLDTYSRWPPTASGSTT